MRKLLFFVALLQFSKIFSQDLIHKKDIVYGKAFDWHNNIQDLNLDLFYPSGGKKFPLIVFVHGGGFEPSSKEGCAPFCELLAKRGFVVANTEYRTGFEHSLTNLKMEIAKAVYRAEQDQLAAIRYLIHHATEFFIDTSAVFIAGESAGGVTSLFSGYVNQEDWDHVAAPLHESLGAINSSGNDLNDRFKIKGVINLWGGIADTTLIDKQEMQTLPVLLFHSVDDADVPFEQSSHPKAKNILLQGSRDVTNRFKNNNGCYELHYIYRAGHGYGFSSDYLSNAISKFIATVLQHQCSSSEIENKGNISLTFLDPESAAKMTVENKTILLSPEILQQYAGQYEARGVVITIIVEGDHLKTETPGEDSHELYPVKKDIFIEKKLNIQATFTRDAAGNVVEHSVILNKNKEFRYKKIK